MQAFTEEAESIWIKVLNSDYSGIAGRPKKKAIANSIAIAEAIINSDFFFSNFIFYIYTNYQHNQYWRIEVTTK